MRTVPPRPRRRKATSARTTSNARAQAALLTDEFAYQLPAESIAQEPLVQRDASRLLHLDTDGRITDRRFADLVEALRPGDLLVGNDTRVRRARLHGTGADGRPVEILVLERAGDADTYRCLLRPAGRAGAGTAVTISTALRATVLSDDDEHPGARLLRFDAAGKDIDIAIEAAGTAPLPPYIRHQLIDAERYQTVYASGAPVSAAAPTAGLHFTPAALARLLAGGVGWTALRLDVGLATFAPMRTELVDDHVMPPERYDIPSATVAAIQRAHAAGGRVIAVGTTVVRALESAVGDDGALRPGPGIANVFLRPGHTFRIVDGLLTNFHQPRSSLLVLVAAFAGVDRWRPAYEHALAAGYRFLSFGDCMLCWRRG
jgi:S-adenosylmethionine:tRNA ribosyltransferase-isomerase